MKKFLKVLLIIFIVIFVLFCVMATVLFFKIKNSPPSPAIVIGSVNLDDIRDGSYTGEFQGGPVKAVMKVDVADHKITAVKIIKHDCGLGRKAEVITKEIEKVQSLDVDVISGATQSSKVILKATELALEKGKQ